MTFTGTTSGLPVKGGPRKEKDDLPRPAGNFNLSAAFFRATLSVTRDKVYLNLGTFHPGYRAEEVKSVKWDEQTHTLSFQREHGDQDEARQLDDEEVEEVVAELEVGIALG